jgi:hypothetical protein
MAQLALLGAQISQVFTSGLGQEGHAFHDFQPMIFQGDELGWIIRH